MTLLTLLFFFVYSLASETNKHWVADGEITVQFSRSGKGFTKEKICNLSHPNLTTHHGNTQGWLTEKGMMGLENVQVDV